MITKVEVGVVDRTGEIHAPEWRPMMVDVSGMSLTDLAARADDEMLARCLRRLAADLDDPADPIAGFNSAL